MMLIAATLGLIIPQPFTLKVTPVTALEGGPVVIDVAVTYTGPPGARLHSELLHPWGEFAVEAPAGWPVGSLTCHNVFSIYGQMNDFGIGMAPGTVVRSARVAVHQRFVGLIPPGPAVVRICWSGCHIEGACQRPMAEGQALVDVPRFTPERMAALVALLEREAARLAATPCGSLGSPRSRDEAALVEVLTRTAHPELAELALRLLAPAPGRPVLELEQGSRRLLRQFIHDFPAVAGALDEHDVTILERGPHPDLDLVVESWGFREWFPRSTSWPVVAAAGLLRGPVARPWAAATLPQAIVSGAHLNRLLACRSVWLRNFVCVTFRNRVPAHRVDEMLRDLAAEVAPIGEGHVAGWVADLDHADFRRREAAGRELLAQFPRTRGALKAAERGPLSLGARDRAADLLRAGDALSVDPYQTYIVGWLCVSPKLVPAFDRLRAVLIAGDPAHPAVKVTRDAQAARQAPPPSPPAP